MKNKDIPGFLDIRQDLFDARVLQARATTEEEKKKADELVKKLRIAMAKVIYDYKVEGKRK